MLRFISAQRYGKWNAQRRRKKTAHNAIGKSEVSINNIEWELIAETGQPVDQLRE
jgi:hypothetical protein